MPDTASAPTPVPHAGPSPVPDNVGAVMAALPRRLSALLADADAPAEALRAPVMALLRETLADGWTAIRAEFEAGNDGRTCVRNAAMVADGIVQALANFAVDHVFQTAGPTLGEQFAIAATGG